MRHLLRTGKTPLVAIGSARAFNPIRGIDRHRVRLSAQRIAALTGDFV